ncbi:neutral zinc metallopeptidase [Leucobacter sp. HNU]|uniref:KPN_02809 family neutral zinc metallopeptidase n=1 Tax=Leucobacter sp. HNU TaxID=3236805 RepID=UPI003A809E7C
MGGGIGIVGMIVLFALSNILGVNLTPLANSITTDPVGTGQEQATGMDQCASGADANRDDDCRLAGASNSLDRYWAEQVGGYRSPGFVIYDGVTNSPCGTASNATGPFYCPSDETVYIDPAFFATLRTDFGASAGSLAQMYVLAHEWGHHISKLIGSLQSAGNASGASSGSVRLELQADCFAGAWVKDASTIPDKNGVLLLKPVTKAQIADALDAAAAVGDDNIMQRSGRGVNPDAFTHGTSEQRQRWFMTGYEKGPNSCGTFEVAANQL